jgi:uncharacterized protein DUF1579
MFKHLSLVVGCLACLVSVVAAQNQRQAPQPSAELRKLEYFVGSTTSDGTMTLGPTKGTFAAKDHAQWMNGGFFVENRSEFTTPFGPGTLLEILGYDAARKVYTHDSYSSAGTHISSTGTVDGDTWTWTGTDGRSRHTIKVLSPSTFSFKTEISQDGKAWVTLSEGTGTKSS